MPSQKKSGSSLVCTAHTSVPDLIDPKDKRIAELELAARDAVEMLHTLYILSDDTQAQRSACTALNRINVILGEPQSPHGKQF